MHSTQLFGRNQYTRHNVLKATVKDGINNEWTKQILDYYIYKMTCGVTELIYIIIEYSNRIYTYIYM